MAVIDVVKWDASPTLLAWKFPSSSLATWTQLVVNETQEAFVVHAGVYDGPFGAGRHTLSTENLPLVRKLLGIPFGGASPFSAEVWFVNRGLNLNVKWGTSDPIQLEDPKYGLMIPVRSFGQYWVQVEDSKKFLLKLVGTLKGFDTATLNTYFASIFTSRIKTVIASEIIEQKISILEISSHLDRLSAALRQSLESDLEEYGLALTNFNVSSINVPEDDPAVMSLKAALAKRAELGVLGFTYQQDRSFDVLETAAGNEGTAGGLLGAGLGLGLGVGIGPTMAHSIADVPSVMSTSQAPANSAATPQGSSEAAEKVRLHRELAEMHGAGQLTDEEFSEAKRTILGGS